MLYILIAILMFGILIALHEFGHFSAAKLCGVKVNEFAIGMGPLLLHKQGKETEYSLRLFPIGGFCAMEGEEEGKSLDPRAFPNRPWYQRLIILLAGVFMNFLTGLIIILCLTVPAEQFSVPVVGGMVESWTAQEQGLQLGDRILKVDGHAIYQTSDIGFFLSRVQGDRVDLEIQRDGKRMELNGFQFYGERNPKYDTVDYYLGIRPTWEGKTLMGLLRYTWLEAVDNVRMVWYSLSELVRGAVGLRDMSGPVGIIEMVGQVGEQGAAAAGGAGIAAFLGALQSILWFTSFISINLAVMNLLPIPALDGGQILFMGVNGIYTGLTRKKLDPKYLGWVTAAGFVCLMILMLAVTVSDILKRFGV